MSVVAHASTPIRLLESVTLGHRLASSLAHSGFVSSSLEVTQRRFAPLLVVRHSTSISVLCMLLFACRRSVPITLTWRVLYFAFSCVFFSDGSQHGDTVVMPRVFQKKKESGKTRRAPRTNTSFDQARGEPVAVSIVGHCRAWSSVAATMARFFFKR